MNTNILKIKKKLLPFRKESLGFFPTPLHKLENISNDLGVNVFIKREDLCGVSLFGGNKIRKLEYVLGDAVSKGCDTILTYGATQSNHATQTVAACNKLGLEPVLFLAAFINPDDENLRSNLLLDNVMGADIRIFPVNENESIEDLTERIGKEGNDFILQAEKDGRKCYEIPPGASSVLGSLAMVGLFAEICEQMNDLNQPIDYLVHATGTGGTLSGLCAAEKLISDVGVNILSFSVAEVGKDYESKIVETANGVFNLLESNQTVSVEDLNIDHNFYAPGYELPNEKGHEAIRYLAKSEGILTDPVYTGKAFSGLLDYIRNDRIEKGSNVVFIHTGGGTSLFAEKEIVGDISRL